MASLSSCLQEDKNGRPEVAAELAGAAEWVVALVSEYTRQDRRYCDTGEENRVYDQTVCVPAPIRKTNSMESSFALTFAGSLLLRGLLVNRRQCFKSP